jgi:short-subunit dehydrogenase
MITGAANGIGKAHATRLAQDHGFNLVLVDIDDKGLAAVKESLGSSVQVHTIKADLANTDPKVALKVWNDALKAVPDRNISILMNNLGGTSFYDFHEFDTKKLAKEAITNIFPNVYLSRHALDHFRERNAEGKQSALVGTCSVLSHTYCVP